MNYKTTHFQITKKGNGRIVDSFSKSSGLYSLEPFFWGNRRKAEIRWRKQGRGKKKTKSKKTPDKTKHNPIKTRGNNDLGFTY